MNIKLEQQFELVQIDFIDDRKFLDFNQEYSSMLSIIRIYSKFAICTHRQIRKLRLLSCAKSETWKLLVK